MIQRGDIYWVDLRPAVGSRPAHRRPVVVVQAERYNQSRLSTVIVVVVTSDTALAAMPGNVFLPAVATGLLRDSVANVTTIVTLEKRDLFEHAGRIPLNLSDELDRGLRQVLCLQRSMKVATHEDLPTDR